VEHIQAALGDRSAPGAIARDFNFMLKRMLIMLVAVGAFIALLWNWKMSQVRAAQAGAAMFAPPPIAVSTAVLASQSWQPVLSAVGSLKAVQGVAVSTDLPGIVALIGFESGTSVKKGDLLLKLESQQEEAQLLSAEARRDLAKLTLERNRDLVAKKAVAASEFDQSQTHFRETEAAVAEAKALIARKSILAPFDGELGIRQANLGQYLNPGTMVVSLQSLDPIFVEFVLPQQNLAQLAVGRRLRLSANGKGSESFEGKITAMDSKVDELTRNILVQGTVANPQRRLRPGMFVNVDVLLEEEQGVVAVPTSAISYAPYGDSAFVVVEKTGPDGKVRKEVSQQFVKLGVGRGDQVAVLDGLKAGDEVVTSGVFKLRPGAPVQVNNMVQPGNDLNPKPSDN
jgi:membrane fusion protein (multidrug efflux system)